MDSSWSSLLDALVTSLNSTTVAVIVAGSWIVFSAVRSVLIDRKQERERQRHAEELLAAQRNLAAAKQMADAALREEQLKRELAEQTVKVAGGEAAPSFEEIRRVQDDLDNRTFELNASRPVVLRALQLQGTRLLADCRWTLQPGVNLLLGRNGYGKSLILRTLASMLARYEPGALPLREGFAGSEPWALLELRRGEDERCLIQRVGRGFTSDSVCPVPLLAIPDTRFLNRADASLRLPPDPFTELRRHGARHFLEQLPYHGVVQGLLYSLCLDQFADQRGFERPIFRLLAETFAGLADEGLSFVEVRRIDELSFALLVRTEGNDEPVPIQLASQGTLSVVAMFGLVHQYLKALAGSDERAGAQSAIVLIDEIDAHLHPLWQQRIVSLLRRAFPNVQFIVSAHSPLVVAGCLHGEAAVMRKDRAAGFVVEPITRDFVGATAAEIYSQVFGVEDGMDVVQLGLQEKGARVRQLEALGTKIDIAQREELERLGGEREQLERAMQREQRRAKELDLEVELESLRMDLLHTRQQLAEAQAALDRPRGTPTA